MFAHPWADLDGGRRSHGPPRFCLKYCLISKQLSKSLSSKAIICGHKSSQNSSFYQLFFYQKIVSIPGTVHKPRLPLSECSGSAVNIRVLIKRN